MCDKRHILVVDDDPVLGEILLETLRRAGHSGRHVGTGVEALAAAARECFDLVVSDLCMPQMGGEELWRRLRVQKPELAASMVFVTAEPPEARSRAFLRQSQHRCLTKPFRLSELLALVASVVAASGEPVARRCSGG